MADNAEKVVRFAFFELRALLAAYARAHADRAVASILGTSLGYDRAAKSLIEAQAAIETMNYFSTKAIHEKSFRLPKYNTYNLQTLKAHVWDKEGRPDIRLESGNQFKGVDANYEVEIYYTGEEPITLTGRL